MRLAGCWLHILTMAVALSVAVALKGYLEDVKLAGCWWPTVTMRRRFSDHINLDRGVSGTLRV